MNVWKYIYIKFYKFRRWGLGKTLGEDYAAMLFVASFDVLLYFGILILIDKWIDNVLSIKYEPLYFALYLLGMFTIERLRNRSMCKNGAFERIKKEVENEPSKLKWSLLSILYMIFVILFFLSCCYIGKYGLNLEDDCMYQIQYTHWVFENIDLLYGTFQSFIYDYICNIGNIFFI